MKFKSFARFLFFFSAFTFCLFAKSYSQEVSIELGPSEIALNQPFTITITVKNEQLKSYSSFPEVSGLQKRGTSSSSSTQFINGRMSSSQSITQNYVAQREGSFRLLPFSIKINGEEINNPGATIKIGPPVSARQHNDPFANPLGRDPFDDFFGSRNEPAEFMDVKDEAFLALTTDKDEVYVGEGFTTTLAFYVADDNRAAMQFYDLGRQLTEIVKKIKPSSSWEENFNIENVEKETVSINGKRYSQYKLYQATYYPLNPEPVQFPSVGLEMIKYKVAKKPTFFGQNRMEDYKTFYSIGKVIKVKELPPHPLKQQAPVGKYTLQEEISSRELNTGNSFSYSFIISGEGNISSINKPNLPPCKIFDFYDPNVSQNIIRTNGRVRGAKTFNYYIIPNEPGDYHLGDFFEMVYFDPDKEQYDTLKSSVGVVVKGESRQNQYILSSDPGSFYDRIELEENVLVKLSSAGASRIFANIFIVTMLALTVVLYIRRK